MSRIYNCILLSCDRCGHAEYCQSEQYAKNVGWGAGVKLPDEHPMDLCPKCNEKLGNLLHEFLYGDVEQNNEVVI